MTVRPVPEGYATVTPWIISRDADAVLRQAVAAGGTSVTEVTHLFFGDRVGRVRDPLGNLWWIQTRVEDLTPQQMERRLSDPAFAKGHGIRPERRLLPSPGR